jgi:hypothetical protein
MSFVVIVPPDERGDVSKNLLSFGAEGRFPLGRRAGCEMHLDRGVDQPPGDRHRLVGV